ncbi:MAG: hypothetical protein COB23_06035 [Methylophaga sp.]|nr:MAG: hypothetical protein COB23_06035 [Methylophaga sp.]
MAKETLHFKSKHTDQMKKAPVGYSWTTLFFTIFVPLLRGDWKWAIIMFLIVIVFGAFVTTVAPTVPPQSIPLWTGIIFGFIYNKIYVQGLVSKGYEVTSAENGEIDEIEKKLSVTLPLSK